MLKTMGTSIAYWSVSKRRPALTAMFIRSTIVTRRQMANPPMYNSRCLSSRKALSLGCCHRHKQMKRRSYRWNRWHRRLHSDDGSHSAAVVSSRCAGCHPVTYRLSKMTTTRPFPYGGSSRRLGTVSGSRRPNMTRTVRLWLHVSRLDMTSDAALLWRRVSWRAGQHRHDRSGCLLSRKTITEDGAVPHAIESIPADETRTGEEKSSRAERCYRRRH